MLHHRVSHERELVDVLGRDAARIQAAPDDLADRLQHRVVQTDHVIRPAHGDAHAADHIAAEDVLPVQVGGHRRFLSGGHVHERTDHRGRADIEREAVGVRARVAGLHRHHVVAGDHNRHPMHDLLADGRQSPQRLQRGVDVAGHGRELVLDATPVRALFVQRGFTGLDVDFLHARVQADASQAGAFDNPDRAYAHRVGVNRTVDYGMLAGQPPAICQLLLREAPPVVHVWQRDLDLANQHPAGSAGALAGAHGLDWYVVGLSGVQRGGARVHLDFHVLG